MCKRSGFTLIELLTVVGIIVLLMAILLPVAQGIKHRARDALCQSNLRQWGIVYKMYTDEFDGKLPCNNGEFAWYYPIRSYYSNTPELLLCPSAKKASNPTGISSGKPYGGTFLSWGRFAPEGLLVWDRYGSYGLNNWAYKPKHEPAEEEEETTGVFFYSYSYSYEKDKKKVSVKHSWSSSSSRDVDPNLKPPGDPYWINAYAKNASNIPLIIDCCWLYAYYDPETAPPANDAVPRVGLFENGNYLCMNRHNGGINSVFMDFSTRKVGLKELWTLQWNRQYNTAGRWTRAGGVKPEDWPKWMRKFKDY